MSKRISWIEDNLGIIGEINIPLIEKGIEFTTYNSMKEAERDINYILESDLIITDLLHPKEVSVSHYAGIDFVKLLINKYKFKNPIVVFTVVTNLLALEELTGLGASIIRKPIRPSEFTKKILAIFNLKG
jgi:DNA-binding response OmpR family regulator